MTTYIDVFNGDADGIFSLIQWRKAHPLANADTQHLVTGVKRDIALVGKIDKALITASNLTVLDVSFDKNVAALAQVLPLCATVFYCDHHQADTLFSHEKMTTQINTQPTVCTGLLVDAVLNNTYPLWAIAAAYGDGLDAVADKYAKRLQLTHRLRQQLKQLGVLVNYNGYGSQVDDLHFNPAHLYKKLYAYATPAAIIADADSPFEQLQAGYREDMARAKSSTRLAHTGVVAVMLEDAAWARRISGTYGNQLATENPELPIVVVTHNAQGSYTVSLRAPKVNPYGASELCSRFSTGGGREGAAGINELAYAKLEAYLTMVAGHYR